MMLEDEPPDFGDSGLGQPFFPPDGGWPLDGPEYPFDPPLDEVRATFDLLWRAFGNRKVCEGYLRTRKRFDSRAWRWAIEKVRVRGDRPRSINFLGKIASDWTPGAEPDLPKPATGRAAPAASSGPKLPPMTPSQRERYKPLPGARMSEEIDPKILEAVRPGSVLWRLRERILETKPASAGVKP